MGKDICLQCRRLRKHRLDPWVRKIPLEEEWQRTPVFLHEKSQGQRRLAHYNPKSYKESDTTNHNLQWTRFFAFLKFFTTAWTLPWQFHCFYRLTHMWFWLMASNFRPSGKVISLIFSTSLLSSLVLLSTSLCQRKVVFHRITFLIETHEVFHESPKTKPNTLRHPWHS